VNKADYKTWFEEKTGYISEKNGIDFKSNAICVLLVPSVSLTNILKCVRM